MNRIEAECLQGIYGVMLKIILREGKWEGK